MFPIGDAIFLARKNIGFLINSGHKIAALIVSDFGRGGFRCGGGDAATALRCRQCRRWGTVEEYELMDSEAIEKVRETGDSGMIIGGILYLFLLRKLLILISLL